MSEPSARLDEHFTDQPKVLQSVTINDAHIHFMHPQTGGWEYDGILPADTFVFNFQGYRSRFAVNSDKRKNEVGPPLTWNLHAQGTTIKESDLKHAGQCLFLQFDKGIFTPTLFDTPLDAFQGDSLTRQHDYRLTWICTELRKYLKSARRNTSDLLYLQSMLLALRGAAAGFRQEDRKQRQKFSADDIAHLHDYIDAHLEDEIRIADLARLLDLPESRFILLFKASFGEAPYQFVLKRRVERAQNMLEKETLSLADIAYSCGFSSQQHMTSVFSRHLGVTPMRYRSKR